MPKIRLFISTPITGFDSENEYVDYRKKIMRIINEIRKIDNIDSIYSAMVQVETVSCYDSPAKSVIQDLQAIDKASNFILFYPRRVPSSALIELGYALAKEKNILVITNDLCSLPYMAQGLEAVHKKKVFILEKSIEDITITDIAMYLYSY